MKLFKSLFNLLWVTMLGFRRNSCRTRIRALWDMCQGTWRTSATRKSNRGSKMLAGASSHAVLYAAK